MYSGYLKYIKDKFNDPVINVRKAEIQALKDCKLKINEQYLNMKTLETRDGCFVIHKRYRILEDQSQNMTIISARKPLDCHYRRTYVDKQGITKTEDDLAVIKRRTELITDNGYFKISSRALNLENKAIATTVTQTTEDKV